MISSLSELLESEDLSFWYKRKKWFLWTMAAAQVAETMKMSEAWPDLFYEEYIHQFQPEPTHKFTSSSRGTGFKDILPLNISQLITKTIPISTRKSQAMQWNGAPCCEFDGKSIETETKTWSEFPNGGKAIVEQILESQERKKYKRAGLWESQSGIQVGQLTIWVRSFHLR